MKDLIQKTIELLKNDDNLTIKDYSYRHPFDGTIFDLSDIIYLINNNLDDLDNIPSIDDFYDKMCEIIWEQETFIYYCHADDYLLNELESLNGILEYMEDIQGEIGEIKNINSCKLANIYYQDQLQKELGIFTDKMKEIQQEEISC
jgi:thiaminase